MMDRRDFVKYLALLAAGAAALPEQIAAFEKYYDLNSVGNSGLAAMDELMVSGLAMSSLAVTIDIWAAGELKLPTACNLFGGIVRWGAMPDQKIVAPANTIKWRIKSITELIGPTPDVEDDWLKSQFKGHISYIGQDGIRHNVPLLNCRGSLA